MPVPPHPSSAHASVAVIDIVCVRPSVPRGAPRRFLGNLFVEGELTLSRVKGVPREGNWGRGYIQQRLPANSTGGIWPPCAFKPQPSLSVHQGKIEFETPAREFDEMTMSADSCMDAFARIGPMPPARAER